MKADESAIWRDHSPVSETPGLSVRTSFPNNPKGVEVMLECWDAGSSEPPHSHPGDDMTVVIEGKMILQFFIRQGGRLIKDGEAITLSQGETGYVEGGRIHDAKYVESCRLVYAHDRAFAFVDESQAIECRGYA